MIIFGKHSYSHTHSSVKSCSLSKHTTSFLNFIVPQRLDMIDEDAWSVGMAQSWNCKICCLDLSSTYKKLCTRTDFPNQKLKKNLLLLLLGQHQSNLDSHRIHNRILEYPTLIGAALDYARRFLSCLSKWEIDLSQCSATQQPAQARLAVSLQRNVFCSEWHRSHSRVRLKILIKIEKNGSSSL